MATAIANAFKGEYHMGNLFYKPKDSFAGDFIPYYKDGEFRLFYLQDWRNAEEHGEGTPWYQIGTKDFIHFKEYGEMLARGTRDQQDLYVLTGSVIEAEGCFHIFYTGFNSYFKKAGRPEQAVMHAISHDLVHWEKVPDDTFFSPTGIYEMHDWRDPFVFWNDEAKEYWMLVVARLKTGPSRRRGCIALCASKDLKTWENRDTFWAPGLYYAHEVPDLFKMGEWWYLLYSTFSERFITHYRMSRNMNGPWSSCPDDAFDGRGFYGAKTYSDGKRRFIFGWNSTRQNNKDYGEWEWGGNLVVHEIVQNQDGTLSVKVPDTIDGHFSTEKPSGFTGALGKWQIDRNDLSCQADQTFACAVAGSLPKTYRISTRITFSENTRGCGIMLRVSGDLENAYYIRLEPGRNSLVFDAWPRKTGFQPDGDCPFMIELERPIELVAGKEYELKVFVDGSVCEVYLNDRIAMSARMFNAARMFDTADDIWGVFINEGSAVFKDTKLLEV